MTTATTTPPLGLTPQEARLFDMLSDGEVHTCDDILARVIGRRFMSDSAAKMIAYRLRKKVRDAGYSIPSDRKGYRLVRLEAAE